MKNTTEQLNDLSDQLKELRDQLTNDWEAAYSACSKEQRAGAPDKLPLNVRRLMKRAVACGRIAGVAARIAEQEPTIQRVAMMGVVK